MGAQSALEHRIWDFFKDHNLTEKRILVSLSGGVDSLALLKVLSNILPRAGAVYFHHGPGPNLSYRDQAEKFCLQTCHSLDVPFFVLRAQAELKSEADFREARYQALEQFLSDKHWDYLALGHHEEDLLETRLLRLIRGTGLQGLASMSPLEGVRVRPFLQTSRKELELYLCEQKLEALEDPSNQDLDPLRNWLRSQWLPALEQRQEGACHALARSLATMASEYTQNQENSLLKKAYHKEAGLSRAYYLSLGSGQQKTLLAQYLFSVEKRDFSQSHLEEIQKRLDNPQKVLTFKVAGCFWEVNAQQIKVES
jgi:tRNA(Ile)-lysidine synthase